MHHSANETSQAKRNEYAPDSANETCQRGAGKSETEVMTCLVHPIRDLASVISELAARKSYCAYQNSLLSP